MTCNTHRDNEGKVIYEDYYKLGAHVYEFPQGRGKARARVAFDERTEHFLWEENNGRSVYERNAERIIN